MSTKYKQAYTLLGEERVQNVPRNLSQNVVEKVNSRGQRSFISEADQFWELRKDEYWTQVPGFRRCLYCLLCLDDINSVNILLFNTGITENCGKRDLLPA